MPKKRAAKESSKKAAGDEGGGGSLEKKERLELILKEFDCEVASRVQSMRKELQAACGTVRNAGFIETMKLSKDFLNMKLSDVLAGSVPSEGVGELSESLQGKLKTMSAAKKINKTCLVETIAEEDEDVDQEAGQPGASAQPAMAPPLTAPNTRARPIRAARSRKGAAVPAATPAPYKQDCAWTATPLVTPKFDPRLPLDSRFVRRARKDERVMSMAGSPVTLTGISGKAKENQESQLVIPVGRGKTITMNLDSVSTNDLSNLTESQRLQALKKCEAVTTELKKLKKHIQSNGTKR